MVSRPAQLSPTRRTIFGFSAAMVVLLLASSFAAATSALPAPHGAPVPPGVIAASPAAHNVPATAPPTPTAVVHSPSVAPSIPLSAVIGSLRAGGGPAVDGGLTCTATSPTTAGCASAVHSAIYGPVAWLNESPFLAHPANHPPAGTEASLAFDFTDNAYVFFGGCLVNACPSSQTWVYQFGTWFNDTGLYATSPSARDAAAMDYDFNFGAVLLYGGCDPYGTCPMSDSWIFSFATGWQNETGFGCTGACPAPAWGASLAWDSLEYASVLVDGCADYFCTSAVNQTFNNWGPGTYWEDPGFSFGPLPRAFASLAWDPSPIVQGLILFGGVAPCGSSYCAYNDTWYYDANNGWVAINAFNFLDTGSPSGVFAAALTWDNAGADMVLAGGLNETRGIISQTWTFVCVSGPVCSWTNITAIAPSPARAYMAYAENNSVYAPWFVGGEDSGFNLTSDQWALGVAPSAVGGAFPNPTENGSNAGAWINNTVTGGVGPYYQTIAIGGGVLNSLGPGVPIPADEHFWFFGPGTFVLNITVSDSLGLLALDSVTVIVNPNPQVNITASAFADLNGTTPFSAVVTAHTGVGPFTYAWSWGDGSPNGTGASPTHLFAAKGNYTVTVNVTDSFGYNASATLNVTVGSGPSVAIVATPTTTDATLNVSFSATGTSGQGPYSYSWNFGDGASGSGATVKHAFASGGHYKVNVTLTDSVGGSAKNSVTVTVAQPLAATITASPLAPTTGTVVTFSTTASGGSGTYSYAWTFGDSSAGATTATATHTYASKGTYAATVVITDSLGAKVTKSVTVTVSAPAGSGTSASGISGLDIALIVVVLVVIAGVAAMLMMRRRKPTSTGPMASPPMGATGGSPPPTGPGSPPPP